MSTKLWIAAIAAVGLTACNAAEEAADTAAEVVEEAADATVEAASDAA